MLRAILEGSTGGNSLVKQITIIRRPHLYRMTFRYRERGRLRIGKRLNCDEVNNLRRSGFFDERARLKLGVTDKKRHLANRFPLCHELQLRSDKSRIAKVSRPGVLSSNNVSAYAVSGVMPVYRQ